MKRKEEKYGKRKKSKNGRIKKTAREKKAEKEKQLVDHSVGEYETFSVK